MKINSTLIKTPQSFITRREEIRRERELASGRITFDVLREVKLFECSYNAITGTALNILIALLNNSSSYSFEYSELGNTKYASVYLVNGSYNFTLDTKFLDEQIYTNVNFALKEF